MKTIRKADITVNDICVDFTFNKLEGKGYKVSDNGKQIYNRLFINNMGF